MSAPKELSREVTIRFLSAMNEIILASKMNGGKIKTVKEFASSIGANYSVFSHYDKATRNVTLEMVCQICAVHKVDANYLITGKASKAKTETETLKSIDKRLANIERKVLSKP